MKSFKISTYNISSTRLTGKQKVTFAILADLHGLVFGKNHQTLYLSLIHIFSQKMLTNVTAMLYNNIRARKIPRQLYFSTIYNWREVRCESMSNVIVKENETLDSALRRFKRSCAKAGIQQEIRKREHYEKPSVRRKKKSEAARKRKYN